MRQPIPSGLLLTLALAGSCVDEEQGVPLDRPLFPTGLAVVHAGEDARLLVVSSDFDLAKNAGALLSADLAKVRAGVASDGPDDIVAGATAFVDGAVLPPLADRPVATSGGERVYVPVHSVNRVAVLDLAPDGTMTCAGAEAITVGAAAGAPRCGEGEGALQLAANDPVDVVILEETRDAGGALVRVEALVTLLSSSQVTFFSDDSSRAGPARVRIDASLDLGETIGGLRAAVLRPSVAGSEPVIIAAAELSRDLQLVGARVLLFQPNANSEIRSFDVSVLTGSLSMRDLVLVPGDDGENDAFVAVLRNPDGLARFEIDEAATIPDVRMTALSTTCRTPQALARALIPSADGLVDRVLVTCHDGDVVVAIDPLTLRTTDAVRFAGRGPYDVAVNDAVDPVEVYVSFFLDGSIGVMRFLEGEDGLPHLTADGRIGEALPRAEDGRE